MNKESIEDKTINDTTKIIICTGNHASINQAVNHVMNYINTVVNRVVNHIVNYINIVVKRAINRVVNHVTFLFLDFVI